MKKYYSLYPKENKEGASAFLSDDVTMPCKIIHDSDGLLQLPYDLTLYCISVTHDGLQISQDFSGLKEIWLDYLPNNQAWPLFSSQLKKCVDTCLTGQEKLQWIRCHVVYNHEVRNYYIPMFHEQFDILDESKCIFAGNGRIIKRVYSQSKIQKYSIFPIPNMDNWWEILPTLFVSDDIRKNIKKANLTGVALESAPISKI